MVSGKHKDLSSLYLQDKYFIDFLTDFFLFFDQWCISLWEIVDVIACQLIKQSSTFFVILTGVKRKMGVEGCALIYSHNSHLSQWGRKNSHQATVRILAGNMYVNVWQWNKDSLTILTSDEIGTNGKLFNFHADKEKRNVTLAM